MRVLTDIERCVKRMHRRRPEQHGSRAKRNDGRYRSEAWLPAAHGEGGSAECARDEGALLTQSSGRTAVDSTWSNDSYPNEPYPQLFRAGSTGRRQNDDPHAELKGSRIAHRRHGVERRHRIRRIRSRAEGRVPRDRIHPIGQIEGFDQALDAAPAGEPERAADAQAHGEEVAARAGVPRDELDLRGRRSSPSIPIHPQTAVLRCPAGC